MLTTDAVGGVWNYTLSLASGLVNTQCDCTVVVVGPAPKAKQCAEASGAGIKLIDSGLELDWTAENPKSVKSTARDLAAIGRSLDVDLAHLHAPAFATTAWTMPVVAMAHSCLATWWAAVHNCGIPPALKWCWEGVRDGLANADAIIAPSVAFASALQAAYSRAGPPSVIYNGLKSSFPPDAMSKRKPFVLSAGRLWDCGKNMVTLDVAAGLQAYPIVAVGQVAGPDGSSFEGRNLSTPGLLTTETLAQKYHQASIFASPALYEPFGLAVLEAASASVPLLLSDIPTFRELWGDCAIFLPPREPVLWARAISTLMNDKQERRRLGEAARTRSLRFSQDGMVNQTRALHQAVLARRGSLGRD